MGLSASQARYDMLTARKSDLEFQGQQINQSRTTLANNQAAISETYSKALSNRTMELITYDSNGDEQTSQLSAANLLNTTGGAYILVDSDGNEVDASGKTSKQIEAKLRSGGWFLKRKSDNTQVSFSSAAGVNDRLYTEDDAAAKGVYDSAAAAIQAEDKFLEMELKNVNNQHNAVQTEMEAVKKVIDKNIESSFKTFA